MSLNRSYALFVVVLVLFAASFALPAAAEITTGRVGAPVGIAAPGGTSSGARPATAGDRDEIEAAGLEYRQGMLWDPDNPYVGIGASEAKSYLYHKKSRETPQGIAGLNPEFACRLARFLRASPYDVRIGGPGSAFRSYQQQAELKAAKPHLAARPGGSNHESGLAADLDYGAKYDDCSTFSPCRWAHQNAARFGLRFPMAGPNGSRSAGRKYEPWHIEPSSGPSGGASCGDLDSGAGSERITNVPSSGITRSARDLLGQQEQMCALPDGMQVPCSAIANRGGQQPLAQSQQPQIGQQPPQLGTQNTTPHSAGTCPPQFYCANGTYYYRSSTCVDQVYQKCPAGCSSTGNACASTSTASLPAIAQIGLIAEPTSTPTGVVSDLLFELAISGEEIATLQDRTTPNDSLQGNSVYGSAPPLSQQTFVSGDLRYSQAAYQPQLSALQRTLATMKETLLRVLAYLRPFGSRVASFDVNELPGE